MRPTLLGALRAAYVVVAALFAATLLPRQWSRVSRLDDARPLG